MTDRQNSGISNQKKESGQDWNLNRRALIIFLVLVSGLFIGVIRSFLVSILLASTFVTLFYPIFKRFLGLMQTKRSVASLLTCFLLIVCLFLPVFFLALQVTDQALDLYGNVRPWINELVQKGDSGIVEKIKEPKVYQWLRLDNVDWQKTLQQTAGKTGAVVASVINKTSKGIFEMMTSFFVVFFTMFYLFRDGERVVRRLKYLSPLKDEYEKLIFRRFVEISRATVRGTVVIGLIQGIAGALILLLFGFRSWLLFGVIMAVLSIIPMVGAWLVLIPAGAIRLLTGEIWQGVVIIFLTTVVVSSVDNLLRPRLVGRDAEMHDLLIFFSTLGGISVFGIAGFIVGPVIAALFLTAVDIWGEEFAFHLEGRQI